jgi:hypothetical protein
MNSPVTKQGDADTTNPFFIRGMFILVIVMTLLISGCTTSSPGGVAGTTTTVPVISTPVDPDIAECTLTPCHGLDLTCGQDISEICTSVYQLGDKCRQFARCSPDGAGACQLVTVPEFATCISCVRTCINESGNDPSKSFACEEKC